MLVGSSWVLVGGLYEYMVPYKQEVEELNKPPVHAFLSAFFLSFLLHSVESCWKREGTGGRREREMEGRRGRRERKREIKNVLIL